MLDGRGLSGTSVAGPSGPAAVAPASQALCLAGQPYLALPALGGGVSEALYAL